jgi:hypothetical protein
MRLSESITIRRNKPMITIEAGDTADRCEGDFETQGPSRDGNVREIGFSCSLQDIVH